MVNNQDININDLLDKPITLSYSADSWDELKEKTKGPRVGSYSLILVADAGHKITMVERTYFKAVPEEQVSQEYEELSEILKHELEKVGASPALARIFVPEDFYGNVPQGFGIEYLEVVRDVI